ncbi:MAG: hypothetical protein CL674_09180 [Bdellovibrionaceae bacterium]|nr:hypothetical protein [Pseudobdellovibrionaceae bacterium]|tara:strand:- start:53454 stop:54131 length:678 start_codon:yes stop_codon:yes gene_type:complete
MKRSALKWLLSIICTLSSTAFASETKLETKLSEPIYSDNVRVDSSRFYRANKTFSVVVQPIGFNYNSYSAGLTGSLFVSPRFQLSLSALNLTTIFDWGREDDESGEYVKVSDDREGEAYELTAKVFLGNSFYISPFLFKRRLAVRERDGSWLFGGSGDVVREGEINDSGIGLKIGNQWQWNKFTLGCNWFSISESIFSSKQTGDLAYEYETTQVGLTEFYLGMSF